MIRKVPNRRDYDQLQVKPKKRRIFCTVIQRHPTRPFCTMDNRIRWEAAQANKRAKNIWNIKFDRLGLWMSMLWNDWLRSGTDIVRKINRRLQFIFGFSLVCVCVNYYKYAVKLTMVILYMHVHLFIFSYFFLMQNMTCMSDVIIIMYCFASSVKKRKVIWTQAYMMMYERD